MRNGKNGNRHPVKTATENWATSLLFATVLRHSVGNLQPTKRSRAAIAHQQRLRRLCDDYDAGRRDLAGFMLAIGHCIQLVCK